MIDNHRARVNVILRWLVSLTLIALVLRKVDWVSLRGVFGSLDWTYAIAAWSLGMLVVTANALRWRIFLDRQAIKIPFRTVLLLSWAGQFFNGTLPGSTGGDVMKAYQICRFAPDRKAAGVATIFADRLTAFAVLALLGCGALVFDRTPLRILASFFNAIAPAAVRWILALFLMVIICAGILSWTLRQTLWGKRALRTMAAARESLRLNSSLLAAASVALATHLSSILIAYLLVRALHIPISYFQVALLYSVIGFCVALPITINGHGLREFLLVAYFTQMGASPGAGHGLAREVAVAWSLLLVTNDLLWGVPGGIWYLARKDAFLDSKVRQ